MKEFVRYFVHRYFYLVKTISTKKDSLGQWRTPHADKLPCVTSRLIFTECRSSLTQYLNDLNFHLSRSLNVKCDGVIDSPYRVSLLMVNSKSWSNSAHLRNIRL